MGICKRLHSRNRTEPSYMVAHCLGVATKPYSDGEIVKARIVDAVKCKSEATTFDCSLNCLDYRKRSDVKEAQPVPRIDEIPVGRSSGPKPPEGTIYHFYVMPFGLPNAPAAF
ncbi:hypothetical protein T12_7133 [Trichinella patagoniensis]|uniref:Uncharacterized protein n=1 Tax=Trichinella patagoniensis TaxID=990121 RepID=A0A0V0Z345_9BILA|nr:hypothetical protein T12_7133 [Trichinella patagoniensis]